MLRVAFMWLGLSSSALAADLILIIDDIGHNRVLGERSLQLPGPLNLAFLPHTPHAESLALEAYKLGHGIMLHAPMATEGGAPLGKGGMHPDMSKEMLQETLLTSLKSIPNVQGVNNHMGSLLTQKNEPMVWTMEVIKTHGLFFIDSLTSPKSVALNAAQNAGVPSLERNVFLDNQLDKASLQKRFDEAVKIAIQNNYAVLIAHPYVETLEFLNTALPTLKNYDIQLKRVDDFLNEKLWQEFKHDDSSRYNLWSGE